MKRKNKDNSAFTLIEMLVVMGVIAVLAAVSLFALEGSRESARDARRRSDLETIRSGLELYKADCGEYPSSINFGSYLRGDNSPGCPDTNYYIQIVPDDPVTVRHYYYITTSPYYTYRICAGLESNTSADASCVSAGANCGVGITCSYSVTNP